MAPPSHLGNAESSGMMQLFFWIYSPSKGGIFMSNNYLTTLFMASAVSDPGNEMTDRNQSFE